MAYDEGLAERIRGVLDERPGVSEKQMFGGVAFLVKGHMSVGIVQDKLMVRVGPESYDRVLRERHARRSLGETEQATDGRRESRAARRDAMVRSAAMSTILRFSGAVKRDPAVQAWLNGQPEHLRAMARPWFERMRECGDDVRELMHDGCPTACVGDAGFGYVNTFRVHVNVGFFRGSTLPDPVGLLEGTGKLGRHVKLKPCAPLDPSALEAIVTEAYRNIKACLRAEEGVSRTGRARQ